ncbi:MAG: alpha/beta hydrolase [Acidobacteriota bacterium]|nr:alpha/beta hydrolase [Acidobacteriota bacterium]
MPGVEDFIYDEFAYFHENLAEWDLDVDVPPVRRFFVAVDGLRQVSGLAWGIGEPELVLVHGGAQNAHTFDTVALALGRPLLALDLPGHGHSDPGVHGPTSARSHASDLARALEQLLTRPTPLVGMSLGGLTSLIIAHEHPDLVSELVLVDITPGVNADKARHITNFVNGPATFADFDELLARTIEHNPTRSVSSLRRGILHNALRREDGTWVWRHQQHPAPSEAPPALGDLWRTLEEIAVPVTLVRGTWTSSVVDDDDEARFHQARPHATVVHVEAGHSVQGDNPLALAALLADLGQSQD